MKKEKKEKRKKKKENLEKISWEKSKTWSSLVQNITITWYLLILFIVSGIHWYRKPKSSIYWYKKS